MIDNMEEIIKAVRPIETLRAKLLKLGNSINQRDKCPLLKGGKKNLLNAFFICLVCGVSCQILSYMLDHKHLTNTS